MAEKTLRELRQDAKELDIAYDKTMSKETLEELIVTAQLDRESRIAATTNDQFPVGSSADPNPRTDGSAVFTPPTMQWPPVELPPVVEADPVVTPSKVRDYQKDLEINVNDLNNEFKNQAALFGYYSALWVVAESEALKKKLHLGIKEAELYWKYREEAAQAGTKTTEKQLEASVVSDPQFKQYTLAYIEAKQNADYCKSGRMSFDHRRDMLKELGPSIRKEMDQTQSLRAMETFGKAA